MNCAPRRAVALGPARPPVFLEIGRPPGPAKARGVHFSPTFSGPGGAAPALIDLSRRHQNRRARARDERDFRIAGLWYTNEMNDGKPDTNPSSGPRSRARSRRKPMSPMRRFILRSLFIVGCFFAVGAGVLLGLYYGYSHDLPSIDKLEDYRPDIISEVYSDENIRIGQFFIERRVLLKYNEIPENFKRAIIAAEDKTFYSHHGIDFMGIGRAAINNLRAGRVTGGGSTLTQQLSKLLFLKPDRRLERKIKEALLSRQIERRYNKKQILTFYCNQIYMGHGAYGVAAAAEYFFGKDPGSLTIEECALLAALPKSPGLYSPIDHPDSALKRRNYIIDRMLEESFISRSAAIAAKRVPIRLRTPSRDPNIAPYFVAWVKRYLDEKYESAEIWRKGLRIYTTLNVEMQTAANRAVSETLRAYDKRHGWRGPLDNILGEGGSETAQELAGFQHSDWKLGFDVDVIAVGLVMYVGPQSARVRMGDYFAEVGPKEIAWTRKKSVSDVLRVGDLALFRIVDKDDTTRRLQVTLEQNPQVQGAFVAIDNTTGEVKAMVGGLDYNTSKFNRATQALRQVGSAFKPFVYAAALENGYNLDDTVNDSPVSYTDGMGRVYAPHNYDYIFKGPISLRRALAESRNVPAIRIASQVGIPRIIQMVRRFGVTSGAMPPYLPLALGASEITLFDMVSAYTVFPNRGVRYTPYIVRRVEDYNRNVREETTPSSDEVIKPEIADKMVELLRGVVEFGTATAAKQLKRPVGGKTGTTNDFTDAWFIGFTPSLTAGIWMGRDEKKSLGNKESGGKAALPGWIRFMRTVLQDTPAETFETVEEAKIAAEAQSGSDASDTEAPPAELPSSPPPPPPAPDATPSDKAPPSKAVPLPPAKNKITVEDIRR